MAAMPENRPPTRGDVTRGSLILLFPAAALLHFGYSRAVSGQAVGDARLAVGICFIASLVVVALVVRGRGSAAADPAPDAEGSSRRRWLLVLTGVAGIVLGLLARGASPMWSGAYIAGLAGAVAGLATAGLFPANGEEEDR